MIIIKIGILVFVVYKVIFFCEAIILLTIFRMKLFVVKIGEEQEGESVKEEEIVVLLVILFQQEPEVGDVVF